MLKRAVTVFAILGALAMGSQAQTTTSTQPTIAQIVADRVARLTKLLTLTTAQQATATTLFTTEETAEVAIKTSMTAAQTALHTAILKNDTAGIATAAAQIGTLTQQDAVADATAEAGFYVILTTDQQTKYATLNDAGFDGHGGGGPGGGPGHK